MTREEAAKILSIWLASAKGTETQIGYIEGWFIEDDEEAFRMAIEALKARPTGRWINGKCDQCGGHAPFWQMATTYYQSDFCQNCGAKMEVEHERFD